MNKSFTELEHLNTEQFTIEETITSRTLPKEMQWRKKVHT